jgi:hypothetical protein
VGRRIGHAFASIYVNVSFCPIQQIYIHRSLPPAPFSTAPSSAGCRTSNQVTTQELANLLSIHSSANPFQICATITESVTPASETITQNANPCRIPPAPSTPASAPPRTLAGSRAEAACVQPTHHHLRRRALGTSLASSFQVNASLLLVHVASASDPVSTLLESRCARGTAAGSPGVRSWPND